ncbi:MAG TPA: ABC transporter ATP-binding protein/permease [Globicatella sulfidifaciens]|uniref:ABC transporter ATP-binding protein n=1 Tax=Globicatella sulfidifaciens TaxID=136093 RepID=UPI001D440349|nr:ABC transporter ATP-binding protein [Globicatella sulfidifaciens]MDT2768522.1 ABC transporter ATP-binding protein [Globicatella sulfidifaciens]HJF16456.1 ABC transporter ATP-binding protein/permease [Globicatella sulfidifaciens]
MKEKMKYSKILLKELYAFKPTVFIAILLATLISAALPLLQLLLSAFVIQWLMEGVAIREYLLRLLVFIVLIGIAQMGNYYFMLYQEENMNHLRDFMRNKIETKYLKLDYPLIIGKEAQERYNNASELTDNNTTLFGRLVTEIIELMSSFLGVVLYINILSQLESLFLVLVGVFLLIVVFFNVWQVKMDRKLFQAKAANSQKLRYLRKVYGESRITKDVRIFQMKDWFKQVEDKTIAEYHRIIKPKVRVTWTESTLVNVGIIGLSALSYIRSVQLIAAGAIPVSSFVIFAGSVTILAQTIMTLVNAIGKMNTSLNETKKYDDFMSQGQVFNHEEGRSLPKEPLSIELKNVSYTYPNNDTPTINNVSLTIKPYENLAIVGENGAGKSTLTNLIAGLLKPDSGEIYINGVAQSEFNISDYYALFAPVFQEKFLLTYSIKETVIQGLPFDELKYNRVLKQSGLTDIISKFKSRDETKIVRAVYPDGVNLSGGQLQKLKLAQALYKDAPVLLLDEPTAALDPIAEHQIYQDYFQFSKDKLSVFISHRLSSTRFCDRIIYIKDGDITEVGTHEELMAKQKDYFKLYEAQAYYYKHDKEEKEEEDEPVVTGGVI